MKRQAAKFAAALAVAVALASAEASAHAFLDHATPAVGSQVRGPPSSVTLVFTQDIEPAFSTVRVVDAQGRQVDDGGLRIEGADHNVARVMLRPLAPGTYRVVWHVLSVDTHVTDGDFTFTVVP